MQPSGDTQTPSYLNIAHRTQQCWRLGEAQSTRSTAVSRYRVLIGPSVFRVKESLVRAESDFKSRCKRMFHDMSQVKPRAAIMPWADIITLCAEHMIRRISPNRLVVCSAIDEGEMAAVHQQWCEQIHDREFILN